jgi:hypothetical protein
MQVTLKGFIHAEKEPWDEKAKYAVYPFDMSKTSRNTVLIGEQDIEVDIPDGFDIRPGLVENLEKEKQRITAEFQARVTELNGQIQSLLALEGPVSEVVA